MVLISCVSLYLSFGKQICLYMFVLTQVILYTVLCIQLFSLKIYFRDPSIISTYRLFCFRCLQNFLCWNIQKKNAQKIKNSPMQLPTLHLVVLVFMLYVNRIKLCTESAFFQSTLWNSSMMMGEAVVHFHFCIVFCGIKPQLIHCTFDEYLGSFQFLAIVNNAYVNILVHVSWCVYAQFLLGIYLEVELLGYRIYIGSASAAVAEQFPKWLY